MRFKKIMILTIILVTLLAVSTVSAAENVTSDFVGVDNTTDEISNVNDVTDVVINDNENNDKEFDSCIDSDSVLSSNDNEILSYVDESDVLGSSPPHSAYSVSVSDTTINYGSSGSIVISVSPCSGYDYRYDFYLRVYDSNNNQKISKNYYSTSSTTKITHTISANELSVGTYTIKLVNYADSYVMDAATLTVKSGSSSTTYPSYSDYSVSVSDTTVNYGSSGSIYMSISPASRTYYKYDFYLRVYDSSGTQKISQEYYGTSSAYSKTYSLSSYQLSAGTYTIKIVNYYDSKVMDTATLTVKSGSSSSTYPSYSSYSVSVSDTSVNYGSSGSIYMSISPASSSTYKYDFYLKVYDSNGNQKISQQYYSTSSAYSKTYSLSANQLSVGTYTVKIVNYADSKVMDTATLTVKSSSSSTYPSYSSYSVSVSDSTVNYGSSGSIYMSISPASSSTYKYDFYLKVYDSNGNQKISQEYYGTSSAYSKTYSLSANQLSVGTYTVKIVNYADSKVMDTATLTVKSESSSSTYPSYSSYSVSVSDTTVNYGSSGSIYMSISPASSSTYKYDFYLRVYDSSGNQKISQQYYSTSAAYSKTYTLSANKLSAGTYTIKIVNYYDNKVMDTATLTVKSSTYPSYSDYSVSVSDTSVNYGSSGSIYMSISPASRTSYKYDFYLKVYDSYGNQKISQQYYSTSSAYSKTYSLSSYQLSAGTYTIKIVNYYDDKVMDTATLTVNKINLETHDLTGNCDEILEYKVRVSENDIYKSGLKITFNCDGNIYTKTTDSNGYATLNIHLTAGTHDITTQYGVLSKKNKIKVNQVYVANTYKGAYVKSLKGYYNGKNIIYGWKGNLKGYFKIYKGNELIYQTKFNTNGYINDYFEYTAHNNQYSLSKMGVGTYSAVMTDSNGNTIAKGTIKIVKSPTKVKCNSFSSKIGSKRTIKIAVYDKFNSRKNVAGIIQVKINGKVYKAKVKNGLATIKNVKLPLYSKAYTYKVKFLGNKNFKASSTKLKIKLFKGGVVILDKNHHIKIGKCNIELSSSQYNALVKAFNKDSSKSIVMDTGYEDGVVVPYTKVIKKYTTTRACKTWYAGSYMPMINSMLDAGWTKVSEYTYDEPNPRNKEGIGLSAYTIAVCKWVKVYYEPAYKTKYYPIKANIVMKKSAQLPVITLYSHGEILATKYLAIA